MLELVIQVFYIPCHLNYTQVGSVELLWPHEWTWNWISLLTYTAQWVASRVLCMVTTMGLLIKILYRSAGQVGETKTSWHFLFCPCMVMVNSLRPSNGYMHQWNRPSFVQMIACCQFGAKPLSDPMLVNCNLRNKLYWKYWNLNIFIHENTFENIIWKMSRP